MIGGDLPDRPFPPGFFDDAEDEEIINQREIDEENLWEERQWQRERQKEREENHGGKTDRG
jgi:hypothetical protein